MIEILIAVFLNQALGARQVESTTAVRPQTVQVASGSWRAKDSAFARVRATQQTVVRLPFPARVSLLPVEPGARVRAGQELLRFEAPGLRDLYSSWQQARRELDSARMQLRILREGQDVHAVTRREVAAGELVVVGSEGTLQATWRALAGALEVLGLRLDQETLAERTDRDGADQTVRSIGVVRAPFAGLVAATNVTVGQQVEAWANLLELERLDQVYLDVGLGFESLVAWSRGEARVSLQGNAERLRRVAGSARLDAESGLWLVRYEAVNPGYVLGDGAWVEVDHLGEPRKVLFVPEAAVVARNGKTWCMVERAGGVSPVEVLVAGKTTDGLVPVLEGLGQADRVVIDGAYELLYGDLKHLVRFVD